MEVDEDVEPLFPPEIWCHILSFIQPTEISDAPFLYKYLELNPQDFIHACESGRLHLAIWALDQTFYDIKQSDILEAFAKSCQNAQLEVLQWLIEFFNINLQHLESDMDLYAKIFDEPAYCGRLDVLQWLERTFKLRENDEDIISDMFTSAAHNGHIHILQWITETLHFTQEEVVQTLSLTLVAGNGDIEILKWITTTFDIKVFNISPFIAASQSGKLEVLKWLTNTFGYTHDDVISCDNAAFHMASSNGHLHVLQWMTDTFQLCSNDIYAQNHMVYNVAHANNHLHVVQWLDVTFPIQ